MENHEDYDCDTDILDLTGRELTTIQSPRYQPSTLILDTNNIALECLGSKFIALKQLSMRENGLVDMSYIGQMQYLQELRLSHNAITKIQGLEKLEHLAWLDLSDNSILVIEGLPTNNKLHHVDLSDNEISSLGDLRSLDSLTTLLLHGNKISSLKSAPSYLPSSLETLSMADNTIVDLNEIRYLSCLTNLSQVSIAENPCVTMTPSNQGFDYRSYVWNWCPSLFVLDGYALTEKEKLTGEWLYSQGKGRHFHAGQHVQLIEYLALVCPLTSTESLQTKDEVKLNQVLSQQRKYQREAQHQQLIPPSHHYQPGIQQTEGTPDQELLNVKAGQVEEGSLSPHGKTDEGLLTSRKHGWAGSSDYNESVQGQRLTSRVDHLSLQDVVSDSDTKSNTSLLESESRYLPFNIPASPVVLQRPANQNRLSAAKNSFIKKSPTEILRNENTLKPESDAPRVNIDEIKQRLDQRGIRAPTQAKKSVFSVTKPFVSNSEPQAHVNTHRETSVETARSENYESSSEQASESESRPVDSKNIQTFLNIPSDQNPNSSDEDFPLEENIKHIKSIADNKKSEKKKVKSKEKVLVNRKASSLPLKTVGSVPVTRPSSTLSASAIATNAVLRAKMKKTSAFNETTADAKENSTVDSNLNANSHQEDEKVGKSMKSPIAQDKDVSSAQSLADSGFQSKPLTDVFEGGGAYSSTENRAATSIQAFWRGYWARENNTRVVSIRKEIRARRAEDHISLLRKDLEKNRKLYEEEKRLRVLQLEAIRLLYQEVQVLKSQNGKDTNRNNLSQGMSPSSTAVSVMSTMNSTYSSNSDLNRTQELEKTCQSLQSQVHKLQQTLQTVFSKFSKQNSLDDISFDFIDNSEEVQVLPCSENEARSSQTFGETSHWSTIPHSLSPYPSEEEESHFLQVPNAGAPTPPRRLRLKHHSLNSLLLAWQPSSCLKTEEEKEGNRHLIGYRIYINDQLKAFVCQKTSALVEGLNPNTTYKIYVKALSGFGESFESNIIMAKLAKGRERKARCNTSGSESSCDSDKDRDSTDNHDKRRRNRKTRKSPRSSEKMKATITSISPGYDQGLSDLPQQDINQNNSSLNSPIIMQPKLHKHRRASSRDRNEGDASSEMTSIDNSPAPGMTIKSKQDEKISSISKKLSYLAEKSSPTSVRQLPRSPLNINKEIAQNDLNQGESEGKSSRQKKRESPPSGSGYRESGQQRRKESSSDVPQSAGSSNVSPVAGSDKDKRSRMSPKTQSDSPVFKQSPTGSLGGNESSLSETFTIDKDKSFLESLGKSSEATDISATKSPQSGSKGHRRNRSKDIITTHEDPGSAEKPFELDVLTPEEAMRLSIGKSLFDTDKRYELGKAHGHRRKKSNEAESQRQTAKTEDERDCTSTKEGSPQAGQPIIDGRQRRHSGSRPSSPNLTQPEKSEEKQKMTVAESVFGLKKTKSGRSDENESNKTKFSEKPTPDSKKCSSSEHLSESGRESSLSTDTITQQDSTKCVRSQSFNSSNDFTSSTASKRDSKKIEISECLQKLENISKNASRERKDSSRPKSSSEDVHLAPDEERRVSRRSRNLSESDIDGGASDPSSQLPPRMPSDSSSGGQSDDSRHHRRGHRRTPSDHKPASYQVDSDLSRATHSPIIMEGGTLKKSGSNVRRNRSFHGLLPSKHASATPEETPTVKTEEQSSPNVQSDTPTYSRSHSRKSRSPSPAQNRQPIISAAQLRRTSGSSKLSSEPSNTGNS